MMESNEEIMNYFKSLIEENKDKSVGLAAIETLMKVLEVTDCQTVQELRHVMIQAIEAMKCCDYPITSIASGSELFMRFITLTNLDFPHFDECRKVMMSRGHEFINSLKEGRQKIAEIAYKVIKHGDKILTYSKSRVVLKTFQYAKSKNISFHVYVVTESDGTGKEMYNDLVESGISCSLHNVTQLGAILRKFDYVMVGAEGVCQCGGIINKSGTSLVAVCTHEVRKQLYVLAESFKFTTLDVFDNSSLKDEYKYTHSMIQNNQKDRTIVDYTPKKYINLFFTDIGVHTPPSIVYKIGELYV